MEWLLLAKAAFALVFVVALIGLASALAKRFNLQARFSGLAASPSGRLRVKESLMIDARHRLVLVQRDGVEHLLLIGPQGDLVVESGIEKKDESDKREKVEG